MLFSRSVEYAIRALGRLAELPEGSHYMTRLIAEEERIPAFFLAKTLQSLARVGILRSAKGPTGGFRLNRPAKKIRLMEIIEALDGSKNLENGLADLPNFRPVRITILSYLRTTTIADIAEKRQKDRRASRRKKATKTVSRKERTPAQAAADARLPAEDD